MTQNAKLPALTKAEAEIFALSAEYGLPIDSVFRFAQSGYAPQEKQIEFHAAARSCDSETGPDYIGFGGARGPGKSHAVFAQIALDDCQRIPNLKVLYLRKISKNAREQFEDLRRSVLFATSHEYNRSSGVLSFENQSRIVLGHFRTEGDIDQYLGLEYDIICIEEATTLTKSKWDALRDSNRTSKPNFKPRIYASTNPGGVGHLWFKKMFIEPARARTEKNTKFVFATVSDNIHIDSGYKKKLEENTGWKLRAYRFGDWDIAAGQFFTPFNYQTHSIAPEDIPKVSADIAEYWCALDYGWNHYTVCLLLMKLDGITYVLAEHADRLQSVEYHSEKIIEMLARFDLTPGDLTNFVAGSDVFAQRGAKNAETIADQYAEQGIYFRVANTDRVNGWARILKLLGDAERKIEPKIKISENCVRLLECLPILEHDPNRPEDVKKVDTDENGNGGDDPGDTLRYGVMVNNSVSIG